MLATEGTWREADAVADDWRALARPVMIASVVLVLAIGAFLLGRRLGGAMHAPIAPLPLAVTATALTLWAATTRLRLRFGVVAWLPLMALALYAIACSYPGARWYDWAIWLAALTVAWFAPARLASASKLRSPAIAVVRTSPEVVTQQLSRSRSAEDEAIHGTLLAEFAPGERTVTLHVAFCPPFEQVPHVVAEADGCDVRVVQVLHQGAQLDVRRSPDCRTAERIAVEFAATCRSTLAV